MILAVQFSKNGCQRVLIILKGAANKLYCKIVTSWNLKEKKNRVGSVEQMVRLLLMKMQ